MMDSETIFTYNGEEYGKQEDRLTGNEWTVGTDESDEAKSDDLAYREDRIFEHIRLSNEQRIMMTASRFGPLTDGHEGDATSNEIDAWPPQQERENNRNVVPMDTIHNRQNAPSAATSQTVYNVDTGKAILQNVEPEEEYRPIYHAKSVTSDRSRPRSQETNEKCNIRRRRSASLLSNKIQECIQTVIRLASDPNGKLAKLCQNAGYTGMKILGDNQYPSTSKSKVNDHDNLNENYLLIQAWEKVRDSRGRSVLTTGRSPFSILGRNGTNQEDRMNSSKIQAKGLGAFRHTSKQYYFHIDELEGNSQRYFLQNS